MTILQAAPQGSNAPTQADLEKTIGELGELAGKGKNVQIQFDLQVAEAAYLGTLALTEHKHGKDIDDATHYAAIYWKRHNANVIFDQKADNQRKTISNVRKMIKLGGCPKWGNGQPMGRINDLLSLRKKLKDANKKVKDAHNALTEYATAQLKRDMLLDDAELEALCLKDGPEEKSLEQYFESMRKVANKMKVGKLANCPELDNSPEVQTIINACTKRLVAIAKARAPSGGITP
jgi:hypothetical protein